jgi:hypothetical protein
MCNPKPDLYHLGKAGIDEWEAYYRPGGGETEEQYSFFGLTPELALLKALAHQWKVEVK